MTFCPFAVIIFSGVVFFAWQGGSDLSNYYPCPNLCKCNYPWFMCGSFVDCSNRGLTTVPRDIPANAVELDLSSNNLASVPSLKTFQSLRKLDLAHNKIGDHGIESITGDDNELEELKLSHNQLTKFPTALPNCLTRLDLTHNYISTLSCTLLTALPPLKILILSQNKLSVLPKDSFCPQYGDAPPLSKSLHHLDLSRNNIHTLEEGAFKCLTQIENLNLSGNLLSILGPRDFQGLTTVRSLDLSCNALMQMAVGTLSSMTVLQYLNLARNQLTSVPRHLPTSLELLDLSNNAITIISEDPNLLQIDHIFLAHNPLTCDCRLRWIKNHLVKSLQFSAFNPRCPPDFPIPKNESAIAHLTPRCAHPPSLTGQLISQLDDSVLVCCDDQTPQKLRRVEILPPRMSSKSSFTDYFNSPCSCPRLPETPWVWLVNHNETTISVEWNILPALEKYNLDIQFHIFGYRDCKIRRTVNIQDKQIYLTDLKPDTNYIVCVAPRHCPESETPILLESCFEITTLDRPFFQRVIRALLGNCSCGANFLGLLIIGLFVVGLGLILSQLKFAFGGNKGCLTCPK